MKNKIEIKIHFSVYIFFLLSLFVSKTYYVLFSLIIIIFHELSHILASLFFRVNVKKITITIIGGLIDIDLFKIKNYQRFIIAISGILFNILLIVLLYKYKRNNYINEIIEYNYLLIYISILPIYPLDGYNIVESSLDMIFKNNKYLKICNMLSVFILIFFLIYSFYYKIYSLIIMGLFLVIKNIELFKNYDYIYLNKVFNLSLYKNMKL